jgi:hypothetical protein
VLAHVHTNLPSNSDAFEWPDGQSDDIALIGAIVIADIWSDVATHPKSDERPTNA